MTGMVGRFGRIFLRYGCKTLLLLLAVSVIAFALVSLSPVDPVQQYVLGAGGVSAEQRQQLEEYWGVNAPPVERYITWLKALVRGDFGQSLLYRRPVLDIIGERFVNSLALMLCAWRVLGPRSLIMTLLSTVLLSAFIDLSALFLPAYTNNVLLASVFGGAVCGLGVGLLFPVLKALFLPEAKLLAAQTFWPCCCASLFPTSPQALCCC